MSWMCPLQGRQNCDWRANLSVERHGNKHVVEGINQVAIALLRAFDYGKELVELLITGRRSVTLLDCREPGLGVPNIPDCVSRRRS